MKKTTRKQALAKFDRMIDSQSLGHLICRTCGVPGCCILAHDNTLPKRPGDKFMKGDKVKTYHGAKLPGTREPVRFEERRGGFIDENR